MKYILTLNRQQVLLGPIHWNKRMFQSEIDTLYDDGEISTRVFAGEIEQDYSDLGEGVEIIVVSGTEIPEHDSMYQQLVGPTWRYNARDVVETYEVTDIDLAVVKSKLKELAAGERYKKEIAGPKTTIQGLEVSLDTTRDGRHVFVQKYLLMGDTDTVEWKFPEGWLVLTKAELGLVVATGAQHIQDQFTWEAGIVADIDAATTAEELKAIVIVEPVVTPGVI